MQFIEAIKSGFKNYFNFDGRASRSEFWYFHLFYILCYLGYFLFTKILIEIGLLIPSHPIFDFLLGFFALGSFIFISFGFLIPFWSLQVRRLHDINLSGYYILVIVLLPGIGWPWVWLYWNTKASVNENNKYNLKPTDL